MAESGIASYQNYGSTNGDDDLTSVAFRAPTITAQPNEFMDGPQYQYQPLHAAEPEFSVECFNSLNTYLIGKVVPPRRKAKSYIFFTKLNILIACIFCGCCSCPFFFFAHRWAKSVKVLNNQQDYLSARSRSCFVVCCNIAGLIMIFLGDALILLILVLIGRFIHGIVKSIDE